MKPQALTAETMSRLLNSGFSRIPVFRGSRANITGLLLIKRLLMAQQFPDEYRTVADVMGSHKPIVLPSDINLTNTLNRFQQGRSHLALVCVDGKHALGTLFRFC
jgi:CBS domain containing-hemolysin-like protein